MTFSFSTCIDYSCLLTPYDMTNLDMNFVLHHLNCFCLWQSNTTISLVHFFVFLVLRRHCRFNICSYDWSWQHTDLGLNPINTQACYTYCLGHYVNKNFTNCYIAFSQQGLDLFQTLCWRTDFYDRLFCQRITYLVYMTIIHLHCFYDYCSWKKWWASWFPSYQNYSTHCTTPVYYKKTLTYQNLADSVRYHLRLSSGVVSFY